jgi:5'-nucleotidase
MITKQILPALTALLLSCFLFSCDSTQDERLITILSTNDIHGGIEPQKGPKENNYLGDLNLIGGLAFFSGAVHSIKQGLQEKYGDKAGVLTVDAGDQFQGTLISNYTEGSLVFSAMNDVGYDAAITGNHDYDFGPHGWLVDDVKDVNPNDPLADHDSRGVIKELANKATFPILSANTFFKNSFHDKSGKSIDVAGVGCVPAVAGTDVDWLAVKQPDFLKPYLIKEVAGVRVALIGIDTTETPTTTTPDNVSDLCFRNEFDAYRDVRQELEGKADVFVLIIHDGDTDNSTSVSDLVQKLAGIKAHEVDAVISAHTHYTYNKLIAGIPVIQSGHGGDHFGRIDLVYDLAAGALETSKTVAVAGAPLTYASCDPSEQAFCQPLSAKDGVAYEGVPVVADPAIIAKIADARKNIAPFATRILGQAAKKMEVDRISESSLADALTDAFRSASSSEIAFMNTGGIRAPLAAGPVTYEDLFKVLPFNNHGYVVGPMTVQKLLALLNRSIQTCGSYGALMESGLKVSFSRSCGKNSTDPNAKLLHVETSSGEIILDKGIIINANRVFTVATLDFLSEGGAGYSDFIGTPRINDMGVLREVLSNILASNPTNWSGLTDGRWSAAAPQ